MNSVTRKRFLKIFPVQITIAIAPLLMTLLLVVGSQHSSAFSPKDSDGDGVLNQTDNCIVSWNPGQVDSDSDGVGDACDNCTAVANSSQCDSDSNGYGNHCDADLNGNGIVNFIDQALLKSLWLTDNPDADLDCNGVVNFIDLELMKGNHLGRPGPSAFAP